MDPAVLLYSIFSAAGAHMHYLPQLECAQSDNSPGVNSLVPLSPDLYILPRLPHAEARDAFPSPPLWESLWLSENQA